MATSLLPRSHIAVKETLRREARAVRVLCCMLAQIKHLHAWFTQ